MTGARGHSLPELRAGTRAGSGRAVACLVLAAVILLSGLSAFAVLLRDAHRENRRSVEHRFSQRAQISAALTQSVFGALGSASVTELARQFGGPPALVGRRLAAQLRRSHLAYTAVLDAHGDVLAQAGRMPRLTAATKRARGNAALSDVRRSASGPVIDYALPFKAPGGRRVLVEGVPVPLLRAFLDNYLARLPNPDGTALVIVDQHGVVLARTGAQGRSSRPRVTAVAGVPGTTWRLRLAADRDRVLTGLNRGAWLAWAMLAGLALAVALGLWLCGRMLRSSRRVRLANMALRESEGKLRGLVDALEEAVFLYFADGHVELLNASAKRLLDTETDILREPVPGWTLLTDDGVPLEEADAPAAVALTTGEPQRRVVGLERQDGSRSWLEVSARPLTRPGGAAAYAAVCSCTDVTERQELEAHLLDLADRDPLTGLWNRRRFEQDLAQQLARCQRYEERAALILFDVDGFKQVNDTLGHLTGDEVLRVLADVLRSRLRATDCAARLGGDEFAVLLLNVSAQDATRIAGDLATHLGEAALTVQDQLAVSISFGVATLDRRTGSVAEALGAADRAMYAAKDGGARRPVGLDRGPGATSRPRNALASVPTLTALHRADGELASLRALLAAVHARDSYTAVHSRQVVTLARAVARLLGLDDAQVSEVEHVALLHDLGKIAVPDAILRKPGPLTPHEQTLMRQHPVVGADIVASTPDLAHLASAIRAEHERWDGAGYPDGLAGDAIPIASRITLVCDAYHAMTSHRPYRRAMSSEAARAEIRRAAGTQFCPSAATALLQITAGSDQRAAVAGSQA